MSLTSEKQDLAASYAVLLLTDAEKEVTVENIQTVLDAAGVTVEPFVPMLFARAAGKIDVNCLMTNVTSGGGAPAAAGAAGGGAAAEPEPEPVKEPSEESSDGEMGFGLFD